tara:strand:- start:1052 stop:1381 length:330 start_codon:yes stop_codon:yes gene_type:complete
METLMNISHNLTVGIAIGLLVVSSVLNWYTIRYYEGKIRQARVLENQRRVDDGSEIAMLKKYKADGFNCDYCGRFASNEKVQRNNMHVACSYKYDEDVTKARKRYGLDS